MGKMTKEEILEAIKNLKLEMVRVFEVENKIISRWKLKTLLNGVKVDLGNANVFIKTNEEKYSANSKEEALQSVESFLKEFFLRNTEWLKKLVKKSIKESLKK
jgi:ribosome-binding factor A